MKANKGKAEQPSEEQPKDQSHRVRLPGFLMTETDDDVGLGDVIKRATAAVGIRRPCSGCEQRAQALNRRVIFTRRHT
jgi:hypothetical protein